MFFSASIIFTAVVCSLRLRITAAAVPVASDGFIIPAELQQSNNETHSSNTTGLNGLQSINATQTGNPMDNTNNAYRYPVPGTEYTLFVSDCSNSLDPTALKATFLKGISEIESEIDQGRGAVEPDFFSAYQNPIFVEWEAAVIYRPAYNDLLHLWKALRLVLLEKRKRFPSWLYSRVCDYRVNWNGNPEGPEAAGEFVIKATESGVAVAGDTFGGTLTTFVGTG